MSTTAGFAEFVLEQLSGIGDISLKKMFGEYGVFYREKMVGVICDDRFFVKITESGRKLIQNPVEEPPYQGAKPYFLMEELEDREFLSELIRETYQEIPAPKPKKSKEKSCLSSLPNIGKEVEKQLISVGITSPEALKNEGSKSAWLKIQKVDESACINRLYGLEGAVRNIRWHDLPEETKKELKEFYLAHKL